MHIEHPGSNAGSLRASSSTQSVRRAGEEKRFSTESRPSRCRLASRSAKYGAKRFNLSDSKPLTVHMQLDGANK
jgi:hypothetical protein